MIGKRGQRTEAPTPHAGMLRVGAEKRLGDVAADPDVDGLREERRKISTNRTKTATKESVDVHQEWKGRSTRIADCEEKSSRQ
jgi:hypothetical protein